VERKSATYCLPYIRLPKSPNHGIFTLKMATAVFSETLDDTQQSTRLTSESRRYTVNSSHENLRSRRYSLLLLSPGFNLLRKSHPSTLYRGKRGQINCYRHFNKLLLSLRFLMSVHGITGVFLLLNKFWISCRNFGIS
jgi:hypothetical protein